MATASKKSQSKGHLPVSRIYTIMKSSSDVEMVTKESSHLMCKATELFIKALTKEGFKNSNNAKKLDYKHFADIVHSQEKYNFLRDIMPKKITVLEYKKIMAKKQGVDLSEKKRKDSSSSNSSSASSDRDDESSSEESDASSASA